MHVSARTEGEGVFNYRVVAHPAERSFVSDPENVGIRVTRMHLAKVLVQGRVCACKCCTLLTPNLSRDSERNPAGRSKERDERPTSA